MHLAAQDNGPVREVTLGPHVAAGAQPQLIIVPGEWQSASAEAGWALVSCVVSPAFQFSGFELAAPGWSPG